jgi:O-antigen/teichoic acid export membrane protein
MSRRRIGFGVGAGVLSLLVDGMAGIALVHLLFKHLHPEEAGFWSLVTTVGTLLMLLPNSLTPAISRIVAQSPGRSEVNGVGEMWRTFRDAVRCSQIALLLVSLLIYAGYIFPVAGHNGLTFSGSSAWLLYVIGLLLTFEAFGHIACLNGLGEVGWDKVIRILTSSFGLLASWWLLRSDGGLLGLGAIFLGQSVVLFCISQRISRGKSFNSFSPLASFRIPRHLLAEGGKMLLLAGGGYIVANVGTVTIERLFGLPDVARYNALLRVTTMISSICTLFPQMAYPYVAQAWSKRDRKRVKTLYLQGIAIAVGLWSLGASAVWFLGDWLFPLWLGRNNYLGSDILFWTLIYQLVYVHHIAHSTPVLAAAGDAFIGSALLIVVLVPCFVVWAAYKFGIIGVPMGTIAGMLPSSVWVVFRCWRFVHQPTSTAIPSPNPTG